MTVIPVVTEVITRVAVLGIMDAVVVLRPVGQSITGFTPALRVVMCTLNVIHVISSLHSNLLLRHHIDLFPDILLQLTE